MKIFKLKKIYLLILLLVLGCSENIKNLDSKGTTIICFGDSITFGSGALPDESYPFYLEKLLNRMVVNAGVAGDTTESALQRLEKDVLKKDPYIVIVELGGNDFLNKTLMSKTMQNLEAITTRIQDKGAIAVICDVSSGIVMSGYRKALARMADQKGALFVGSLMKGILDNPSLRSDHIHPNSEGYRIVAQRVYAVIKNYIK